MLCDPEFAEVEVVVVTVVEPDAEVCCNSGVRTTIHCTAWFVARFVAGVAVETWTSADESTRQPLLLVVVKCNNAQGQAFIRGGQQNLSRTGKGTLEYAIDAGTSESCVVVFVSLVTVEGCCTDWWCDGR